MPWKQPNHGPDSAVKVLIPSALRSYTEHGEAEASGATLGAVLADLDRQYAGIRFRMIDEQDGIRRHIRIRQREYIITDLSSNLRGDSLIGRCGNAKRSPVTIIHQQEPWR